MVYATVQDLQARMTRELSAAEQKVCSALLSDASELIDSYRDKAGAGAKKAVACRMVIRALGNDVDIPMGATQGTTSGLGYSQTWTMGNGGSVGELYLSKTDKQLLGGGNAIGTHSPLEDLAYEGNDSNII